MVRRLLYLSLGIVLLAGTHWVAARRISANFTRFVPSAAPQRASADFDADGRPDIAVIQAGGSRILLALSGSSNAATFEVNATSIVASDIDHDGDFDLTVATSTNQIVIWLNDGTGHFTQKEPSQSPGLFAATTVFAGSWPEILASLGPPTPSAAGFSRGPETAVVSTQVRLPTAPAPFTLGFLALPSLRAPPLATTLS